MIKAGYLIALIVVGSLLFAIVMTWLDERRRPKKRDLTDEKRAEKIRFKRL